MTQEQIGRKAKRRLKVFFVCLVCMLLAGILIGVGINVVDYLKRAGIENFGFVMIMGMLGIVFATVIFTLMYIDEKRIKKNLSFYRQSVYQQTNYYK